MTFVEFARAHGVDVDPNKLFPSDRIRRCGTIEKPKSGNGAYFWDGRKGWVMDWSGEARVIWYDDPNAKPWTDAEKRQWAAKRHAQQNDQQRKYEQAEFQADITMRSAKLSNHPYLEIKGFKDTLGMVLDDKLLIPMRNVVTQKLQGYQSIYWNMEESKYEKKMLYGMRSKNAVFLLGNKSEEESWLVEGYATGLSVHKALRSCGMRGVVVVCFSASNLVAVADQIPNRRFVFADNDASETGAKAARATGLPWTMSDTVGYDANDMHLKDGLFSVVSKIMECRAMA